MVACIVIAGIISILSIFVFFGDAISNTGGNVIPNMFHLMLGGKTTYQGYIIEWRQIGGLTFLFGIEIVMILLSCVAFYFAYKIKNDDLDEEKAVHLSSIQFMFAITAAILSFSTLALSGASGYSSSSSVKLGFGPVFYGILSVIVAILHLIVIILSINSGVNYRVRRTSSYHGSSYYNPASSANTPTSTPAASKPELSENEKADLLIKYKKLLDDGTITEEEFQQKKNKLLP